MMQPDSPAVRFQARLARGAFTLDAQFETSNGITALFGPSGSGKSTILAMIAGLLRPATGKISLRGRALTDTTARVFVPSHHRRIGLVFQDAQLFPHLTVHQNLAFARWFAARTGETLALDATAAALGIDQLMDRRSPGLSGGERQRVALARALLSAPDLLLLDEPLAGLDDARRSEILPLISRLRDDFKIPMLYVTHNRSEVSTLADRVIQIDHGRVTSITDSVAFTASA